MGGAASGQVVANLHAENGRAVPRRPFDGGLLLERGGPRLLEDLAHLRDAQAAGQHGSSARGGRRRRAAPQRAAHDVPRSRRNRARRRARNGGENARVERRARQGRSGLRHRARDEATAAAPI